MVNECSWMNGICFGFLHSTGKSETFSHRRPSSASLRSAASPRGKPRGRNHKQFTTNAPCCLGSNGSPNWRPLRVVRQSNAAVKPSAGDTSRYPKRQSVLCPLGCLPCHNHGVHLVGDVPQPGKTRLGKLFCRRTQGTTVVFTACVPSNSSEMEILSGL